ncbi:MAG: ABC transporter permease [Chloroflexota bacterium]
MANGWKLMANMRRAVMAIFIKECREIGRDPLSLTLALVLPLVLLALFTYGLNLDAQRVRLGVYDLDRSADSRGYLASLSASGDLEIAGHAASPAELRDWLNSGRITIGVIVPPDFQRTLLERRPTEVQVLLDGSYPPKAKNALAQLDAATVFYNHRLVQEPGSIASPAGPLVVPEPRVWFNPELKSVNFIVPGLFSLILMVLPPLLSTLAIVRERERGSIQQVLVAPVSPAAFILGKAIPYGLLAFAEMLLVLAVALLWFQIPFRGSLLLFLLASIVYVFCTVGIGLLISTITRSQVVAMLLALVVTIMPSFLFSGFLFPIYTMPERYQVASLGFPARYFTEFARGLALKGSGIDQLWPPLAALTAYTVSVLLLATGRFHRRMG